ncbi:SusC/RagA family TonB-linked outer membrane protein [Hyunsoonleella pacifica]|uniref:SusC/RagA family TonB-linked outer membrane protein n=1 Tax=Hyunsoonleella pacifica TaxID=1080224 RepID=A0A4Q9FMN7_9FLAO|nr:SusC/RagA family TonB-linked outer membrane protein [Hyunsoonleella pacifica]TBN13087.1 SusC/RagA family TonB-linked outer membrane protein [Hyunsoonleella pacifica]
MKINKIYRFYTLVCLAMLCFCGMVTAQSGGTEVSGTVVDEQGNPLSEVNIYGPKGSRASTNSDGLFNITLPDDEAVVIKKKGYESQLLSLSNITGNITLVKSEFLASEDDEINMGVATKDKRDIVGAISSTNTRDRLTYDNTQVVSNYIAGLTPGVVGATNIRGLGGALVVIDGVFGRNIGLVNMEEVEQITVLKDANAVALYGSQGRNGVIVINTKRGKINQKEVNVNVRSGFSRPVALPNYLDAANFMILRNEARANDGLDPLFGVDQIQNTRSGTNPIQYPDVDLYEFVQPFVNSTNVISEFSGGTDKSRYYVNVGWVYGENWVDINEDINAGNNRFNVRGNIDFKVNDWITSSIDGVAIIASNKSSRANILSAATTFLPFDYAPLVPVSSIDTTNNPELATLLAGANVFNGNLLGSAQQIGDNAPLALAIAGGYLDRRFRVTQINNAINFDLSGITEGLSAKTYLSFDFLDAFTISINNDFRTYGVTEFLNNVDPSAPLNTFGVDERDLSENVNSNGFLSRLGTYALINYEKTFATNHSINTTLLGYYNSQKRSGAVQTDRDSHIGFQMTYDYKKNLFVDFSGSYIHSIKLPEGNRGGFSPTIGLGYILSNESFLKDSNFVNYLKLKASGGIIKSDQRFGYFLYDENYFASGGFSWADNTFSNARQGISQGENLNLGYEERIDLNIGLETYLMNSLWIEANYFRTELDKQLVFLADQYPSYYQDFRPLNNFNSNLHTGLELGLNFNKTFNDFSVGIGANVLYTQREALKRSETNEFEYQNRQGLDLSSIFGLQDLGFYSESDFTTNTEGDLVLNDGLPVPNFGAVQPGDIRYADQNNDGVIDQDDQVAIGESFSPWTYGINLNLKYKRFNLFVLGTGQTGAVGSKLFSGFNNYYAPNGTDKYSEVVLGRWTPETANTATFPRLSSGDNQNNFRQSTFWLYDNSFFRINRAQLTYEFTDALCDKIGVQDFSVNFQGTNLFEISENRDIRQLTIGGNPQARGYTLGIRMSF